MHSHCFAQYTRYNYACPVCAKSMGDMSVYFGMLDSILARDVPDLPAAYASRRQVCPPTPGSQGKIELKMRVIGFNLRGCCRRAALRALSAGVSDIHRSPAVLNGSVVDRVDIAGKRLNAHWGSLGVDKQCLLSLCVA
jgi:hypothetical protein